MSVRTRRLYARVLVVLASVAMVLALVAGYVRRAAIDSDQFANRATSALEDTSVRTLIAERLTDQVVLKRNEDLIAARPIIQSVAEEVVGSSAFTSLFRSAVRDVHRTLFDRDQDTVTLTVTDVGTVLAEALAHLRPGVADDVRATDRVAVIQRDIGTTGEKLANLADDIRLLAWLLLVVWLLLAGGAIAVAPDRRRAVVELGVGAVAAGVLLVVALGVLRSIAVDHVEGAEGREAARAVWDAFLGDLSTAAWILAGSGAVVAAAASSYLKPIPFGHPLRRAAELVAAEPERTWLRAVRGAALILAGVIVLVDRDAVLHLILTLLGAYLIYEGTAAILRLTYRPPEARPERERREPRRPHRIVPAAVAGALIFAAVSVFVGGGGVTTAAPARGPCNGHRQLCDRPLDEVALPATHNAMSVPLPGWYSAEQDAPIAAQLKDGIRGLLIDTHYADRLPNGRLRTEFGSTSKLHQQAREDGVSPATVDAALRIRDRAGFSGEGQRGMYLCHTFCELGGTPLASVLEDLHGFLVANPEQIVVVINQDYVTPKDFTTAVKDAGLGDLVYRGPVSGKWPTLKEAIDNNWRVLFLAEKKAGAEPWYHPAYKSIVEETPYTFKSAKKLTAPAGLAVTCEPNRGPDEAPLFLVNHWVSTDPLPKPSDAAKVNARDALLGRLRECRRIRKHLPNLVAVNFYRRGDLFDVVDTLNGVR